MNNCIDLFDLYNSDREFKTYVDKYARAHKNEIKVFPEDAFKDAVVISYAAYLKGRENK